MTNAPSSPAPLSAEPMKAGDHLFLVDGSAYIFRAYHALPPLTRKSDGLPVGAVSGFCNMLWKLLDEGDPTAPDVKPTHMAVIFDYSSKTFRNELYSEYKANRQEPPEDLRPQFGVIREATRAFSVACIEQEGFEADDLIATYARIAKSAGAHVTIISSDKDLMQLVGDGVIMVDTMKTKRLDVDAVHEKFGVGPDRVIDVQSLAGDSTDNVPGVPGIGIKTAAQLINEFGDLDTLLANADTIKQNKRRQNLIEFADQARISRKLVTLDQHVPLNVPIDETMVLDFDAARAVSFLKFMEFTTLTRRLGEAYDMDVAAVEPVSFDVAGWTSTRAPRGPDLDPSPDDSDESRDQNTKRAADDGRSMPATRPADLADARQKEATAATIDNTTYQCVTHVDELDRWIAEALDKGLVAVDTETTSLDAMSADLVGFSLATEPGRACYVPLAHVDGDDMFAGTVPNQIPFDVALAKLKALLEEPSVLKIAQNLKYDWLVLSRYGITVAPFDDTMLMSYALDAGRGGHGMDDLSERWLGHKPIPFKEVCGSGKSMITFDKVPLDKATAYAAEDADVTLRLWRVLKPRLIAEGMRSVYERLERPMVPCLGAMEAAGVKVDRQLLSRLSGDFAQKLAGLEAEIHDMAGEAFNVASPKQVGEILFGKMGLPGGTKTKTGAWSTGASVLEDLAAEGHDLPKRLLDWRQVSKLKSTYTDALPGFINSATGRVHTSFSLASTSTGRLSSTEPNIQNIPVRTDMGREIRRAFIAEPGNKLISADYSQIELRVLAHMADIPQLKQAFADGLDIHAMTASEMFGVAVEGMDPMVRRRAKAINFGIIYGISAFGLANQLGISREEAGSYIKTYFERFPGIKDYMEATKAAARANGYVETLFGRRAHYPEINTKNPNMRAFFERAAINAPIQGSAADIIRRAMVRMPTKLQEAKVSATMLLQVHDELIFEAPQNEVEAALPIIIQTMETATLPALQLSVPLNVDAQAATNWEEAH